MPYEPRTKICNQPVKVSAYHIVSSTENGESAIKMVISVRYLGLGSTQ